MLPSHFRPCAAALLLIAFCCGCSRDKGPERAVVSGTVTYKGQSIVNGSIRFVDDGVAGGPSAGAFIVDGKYVVDGHGGVPVGEHRVQIEGFEPLRGATSASSGPVEGAVGRGPQFLPEKYNRQTELRFSVPSGSGPIVKNFDLN